MLLQVDDTVGGMLGHYRVEARIGRGGMGEVYRAEDTRLAREVAIKVLPDAFAQDRERLARFEREAKLLAALNHPNVAAIHGLEEHEGRRFLVLELVPGETLAQRLQHGPLSIEETRALAVQIADGLAAAHERGILHRDLKPANVMVTPEGTAKILDFGLGKALPEDATTVGGMEAATLTAQVTAPGAVFGTAPYMSPEQACGKPADKRTDVWAFGCLLYECLTGARAFGGDSATEIVATILKVEPDWTRLPADTPPAMRWVLRHCLEKEPSRRLRDLADAALVLRQGPEPATDATGTVRLPSRARVVAAIAAAAVVASVLTFLLTAALRRPVPPPVTRSLLHLAPGQWLAGTNEPFLRRPTRTAIAFSSDGRFLVYSAVEGTPGTHLVGSTADLPASGNTRPRLYLRRLDGLQAVAIAGTEGGSAPFLSPDDRWIGFWADGKLLKVPVGGGVPAVLCDVGGLYGGSTAGAWGMFGASWGAGGDIVFAPLELGGLFRVPDDGGQPEALTVLAKEREASHRLPHFLPDGRHVLLTVMAQMWDNAPDVALLDLRTRRLSRLIEDAADARYVASGHLVFVRRGVLMAAPFDLAGAKLTGKPVPLVANVMQANGELDAFDNTNAGQFEVSPSGALAYGLGGSLPPWRADLQWVDRTGRSRSTGVTGPIIIARLAPDGGGIAYSTAGAERRVHVYDLSRGTTSDLGVEGCGNPRFAPDGKRIAFFCMSAGTFALYWQPVDGSAPPERLTAPSYYQAPGTFSPDGSRLAFVNRLAKRNEIWVLDLRTRRAVPLLAGPGETSNPAFSPDGRWLAYISAESGQAEVYVRPFPGPGGNWKVSAGGGNFALWSRDGRQLFYRRPNQAWSVDVALEPVFAAGKPRLLFEQHGPVQSLATGWDLSLDGQEFLIVKQEDAQFQPVSEMVLVENWFQELARLVPARKR